MKIVSAGGTHVNIESPYRPNSAQNFVLSAQRAGPSLEHVSVTGKSVSHEPDVESEKVSVGEGAVVQSCERQSKAQISLLSSNKIVELVEDEGEIPSEDSAQAAIHRKIKIKVTDERDVSANEFEANASPSRGLDSESLKDAKDKRVVSDHKNEYLDTEAPFSTPRLATEAFEVEEDVPMKRQRTMRDIFTQKVASGFYTQQAGAESVGLMTTFKYTSIWTKIKFALGIVAALSNGVVGCIHAVVIANLIKSLSPYAAADEDAYDSLRQVLVYGLPFSGGMLLLGYLQNVCLHSAAAELNMAMRSAFIKSFLAQEVQYFEQLDLEKLPQEITDTFESVITCIEERVGKVCFAVGAIAGSLALSLVMSPSFTLGLILVFPSLLCIGGCLSKLLYQKVGVQIQQEAEMTDLASETLKQIRLIVAACEESRTINRFEDLQRRSYQQGVQTKFVAFSSHVVNLFLFMSFILYAWGLVGVFEENSWGDGRGKGDTISVTSCYICMEAFIFAFMFLPMLWTQSSLVRAGRVNAKKLLKLIEREPLIRSLKQHEGVAINQISFDRDISFQNVTFRYPNAPEHAIDVLHKVNFKIEPSSQHTIVGLPKSGKTTILKLLNRVYDPSGGEIYFGANDTIQSLNLDSLRQNVAFIEAEPALLRGSITNNIKLGCRRLVHEKLLEAVKIANAEFLLDLTVDLNSLIGYEDKGLSLTMSQKMRIAIVRAIVADPKVILIDQSDAALDFKSQAQVNKAIDNLLAHARAKNITVVMATNNLRRVEKADRVLYIQSPSKIVSVSREERAPLLSQLKETLFAGQQDLEDLSVDSIESEAAETSEVAPVIKRQLDLPQILSSSERQPSNPYLKAKYGTEEYRVLGYSSQKAKLKLVYLLVLLHSLCIPTLAYLTIRFQLLYFSFSAVQDYEDDLKDYYNEKRHLFIVFGSVVFGSFVLQLLAKALLAQAGQDIESNLRIRLLRAILHMQVSQLDSPENSVVRLTKVLATDVRLLTDAAIARVFGIFEISVMVLASIILAFVVCWQNAIFMVCFSPILVVSIHDFKQLLTGSSAPTQDNLGKDDNSTEQHALLSDLVQKHTMIASLSETNRGLIHSAYERYYLKRSIQQQRLMHARGLRIGFAQAGRILTLFCAFFFAFGIGMMYLKLGEYDVVVSMVLLFYTFTLVGFRLGALPTIQETEIRARNVFLPIDQESTLDVREPALLDQQIRFGHVSIKNLTLTYRRDPVPVLQGVNFEMPALCRIGLVGNTGCGKSTIAHVLRRFYEPDAGTIKIDGIELKDYSAKRLRSQIHHITQVPEILNASIRENIVFGRRDVSDEQIYRAAFLANACGFIEDTESNEAQRRINIKRGLRWVAFDLKDAFPKFEKFADVEIRDDVFQTDLYQLVLDTLKLADLATLASIHEEPDTFVEFVKKALLSVGDNVNLTWLELVLMIEWNAELQAALKEKALDADVLQQFENFTNRHMYDFDPKAVLNSLEGFLAKNGAKKIEHYVLANQIFKTAEKYRKPFLMRQRQRQEELLGVLINKMRSANGTFVLGTGFNRKCGQNGCNLSASQKQRIAIARAILSNPKIMILDQVSAGLDEQGRLVVQKAMEEAMKGRSSLLISTQDAFLSKCDKIYVMSNHGTIAEQGTHSELIGDPDSYYNRLVKRK